MSVLHAGTAAPLSTRLAVAALAGLLATLVAAVPVALQCRGNVPLQVAAAAVWRRPTGSLDAVSVGLAAGLLGGFVFELAVLAYEAARPVAVVVADVLELSDAVGALAVVLLAYVAVAALLRRERAGGAEVRGPWLLTATVYGLALLAGVQVVYAVAPP